MSIRITCIRKADGDHKNAYTAISSMNWIEDGTSTIKNSTREQIYDYVNRGGDAYVEDSASNKAKLVAISTPKGTNYVKTEADDVESDNLLKLDEC